MSGVRAPLRVLFMHGLESGPRGDKVRRLRDAGIAVEAADMGMSIGRLDRPNSVARNALRIGETRIAASLIAGSALGGLHRGRPGLALAGVAAGAGWLALRRVAIARRALRLSYEACVAIQREAIERYRPDVVLGSSWGGAIAVELVVRGAWRGPTVLLAPAFHRVAGRMGSPSLATDLASLHARAAGQRIVVLHDPADATVPLADSESLADGSAIELQRVDAGGHRLMGLLDDGSLLALQHDVAGHRP